MSEQSKIDELHTLEFIDNFRFNIIDDEGDAIQSGYMDYGKDSIYRASNGDMLSIYRPINPGTNTAELEHDGVIIFPTHGNGNISVYLYNIKLDKHHCATCGQNIQHLKEGK